MERAIMQKINRELSASATLRALRYGASCLALGSAMIVMPSFAQDAAPADTTDEAAEEEEGIVVRGYKGSLETAQAIKRTSDVIVDSISSEDIGALPDRSVTETIQRIPGVSIDRFVGGGSDPDHFAAEGSGVTIRGLSYVRSELNGREAFTVNNGRGLSFADVPSELLFGVDVFKSPSSDRIEGGISGVVNLRTRRPFDSKGFMLSGSLENTYSLFAKKSAPTFSGLISTRWETGIGEIGILLSGVSSELESRFDKLQIGAYERRTLYANGNVISSPSTADGAPVSAPVRSVYAPSGGGYGSQNNDRKRYGVSGALQWRSNDGDVEFLAQYFRSDARENTLENVIDMDAGNANDPGHAWCTGQTQAGDTGPCVAGPRAVPGTALTFDDRGVFTSGVITTPTGWRSDQYIFPDGRRVPAFGIQANNISRAEKKRYVTEDISANLKWNITDNFAASFDYQHVSSKVDALSAAMYISTYSELAIDTRNGGFPSVQFRPITPCTGDAFSVDPGPRTPCNSPTAAFVTRPTNTYFRPGNQSYLDPYNSYYYASMDHAEDNDGTSDAARLDFSYNLPENNWIKSIEFGGRYAKRDQVARFSTYNWGALSAQWGNNGPIWLDNPAVQPPAGEATAYVPNTYPNYFGGAVARPNEGGLFFAGNGALDYASYVAFSRQVVDLWNAQGGNLANPDRNSWRSLGARSDAIAGSLFTPSEVNPLLEKNKAAYLLAKINHDLANGWNLAGSIGVRYTKTNRTSTGFVSTVNSAQQLVVPDETGPTGCTPDLTASPPYVPPTICTQTTAAQRASIRTFFNGQLVPQNNKMSYDYILPSVNLRLDVGGGLQFRVAYSKGIAPPDFGYIRSGFRPEFNGSRWTTNQLNVPDNDNNPATGQVVLNLRGGNPFLKPVTSNNFDFTTEWYFGNKLGRLTFAAFYKEIKGINVPGVFVTDITNNGVTFPALVESASNSSSTGKIKGVELGYEQTYDFLPGFLDGFGLSANVTYIDQGSIEQGVLSPQYANLSSAGNSSNSTIVDISKLPLQGLSKWNVNIAPFYQKGGFEARVAYSWRSRYLLTVQDVIYPYQPTFNDAAGYMDGSISYNVNDKFKIGVQGTNLLNTITKTSAAIDRDARIIVPRSWFKSDQTVKVFVRVNF
jgi:TonB-dependent receptor